MSEKAIRLNIARVCNRISRATYHTQMEFAAHTLDILQAMKYELSNIGKYLSCRSMGNVMGKYTRYIGIYPELVLCLDHLTHAHVTKGSGVSSDLSHGTGSLLSLKGLKSECRMYTCMCIIKLDTF